MKRSIKTAHLFVCFVVFAAMFALPIHAETEAKRFEAADSEGVIATRSGNTLYLQVEEGLAGPIAIPRLAASLRSMQWHWQGNTEDHGLNLKPEQASWVISWKKRPKGIATLVLRFDSEPLLPIELKPVTAAGDGSFYLPACLAITAGEKIRYEPQSYKNTVGYWVGKGDYASWTINLDKPGRFNVAVLQGCGKGQGGSQAQMSFISPVKDITPTIDFEVVETGHFQNFQWVQLGTVRLRHRGEVEINLTPTQIKKAALMDVRAVHLIRLPDKK